MKMSYYSNFFRLRKVYLCADVYAVCLQHALSTEKEEVMGLLIGEVDEQNGISHISACIILRRSDKKADRVEISSEQLLAATTYAEHLATKLKRPMRVVGWYHSHPHITVWPSRVDVSTQALYQNIDNYFVGLILSVFPNETRTDSLNPSKSNEVQLTCFQSQGELCNQERREIPIFIKDTDFSTPNLDMILKLPLILREEEIELAANNISEDDDEVDPLIRFHNGAHKFIGMVHITEKVAKPIYEAALAREKANQERIQYLEREKKALIQELKMLEINPEIGV